MNEILNDSTWKKTYELVLEKYGKNLSYRNIKLIEESSEKFYSHGDDLIIPLKIKNHNLGDIIVNRGSLLDIQQKNEIVDLVKFLVEPKIYNYHLKQSEENLKNNITSINKVNHLKLVDLYNLNLKDSKSKTLSPILLLKSHTEMNRHKVALKVHEMAEHNLFVHLDDIAASIKNPDDIKTLSDVTIYIDDVEKVSESLLEILRQYLEKISVNGPLFLIGSSLSMEAIELKKWPESFKKDLMGFYFDIDRIPLAQQTSSEILELLFFQLDNEMT